MRSYEKRLLNHLQQTEVSNTNLPLENVKKAMGNVRYAKGNPLTKTEITLNISVNFFADKIPILPNALPVNLQSNMPLLLLGLTDFYSGYSKMLLLKKPIAPWQAIDRSGYAVGPELATGWQFPAFWDFFGANWSFIAGIFIACDGLGGAPGSSIQKNNFWKPGHKYQISYRLSGTANNFVNSMSTFWDGAVLPFPNDANHDYDNITYTYTPTNTTLILNSPNFAGSIIGLSIKEITGILDFVSEPPTGIYGYNKNTTLSQSTQRGDCVTTYSAYNYPDPILYTCEVIIHCNNVAYGTFLNSFVSDLITINTLRIIVPIANINQFINALTFGYQTLFGKTYTDDIDPRMYITSTDFQQQICDIPINLPIDKAAMLMTYVDILCTNFQIILFVEKIESLTHK